LRAAEMVLVRLTFVTDQPSPADLVDSLRRGTTPASGAPVSPPRRPDGGPAMVASSGATALRAEPVEAAGTGVDPRMPVSFEAVVARCAEKREALLAAQLTSAVHLVHYEIGRLEVRPTPAAPADMAPRLSRLLTEWTGRPWLVGLSHEAGQPTLRE